MRTESDAFRYYTSEGLDALDSTTKAFGLVNRFIDMQDSVPAMGDTDTNAAFKNRVPAGRADGMVIVAHEAVESSPTVGPGRSTRASPTTPTRTFRCSRAATAAS